MADGFGLRASYDYRFATLLIELLKDGDTGEPLKFLYNLPDLIRELGIKPHELAACFEMAEEEPSGFDMETLRRKMLHETDWKGKTVLDVGGYDGFAAKIALDGGAKRAVCLDSQQYQTYGWEEKKFEGVEYITGDFYDWTEPVDVVILFNILYHVKDVYGMLEHCREIAKEQMLLCTLFRYHDGAWVYLYDPKECNPTDVSVIWGPSLEALERLLRNTGFSFTKEGVAWDRVIYRCQPSLVPLDRQSRH